MIILLAGVFRKEGGRRRHSDKTSTLLVLIKSEDPDGCCQMMFTAIENVSMKLEEGNLHTNESRKTATATALSM